MMLRAAFVLPDSAVEELRAVAGRLGSLPGVHPEPPEQLGVRVALLGNVVSADALALADAVERDLSRIAPPVVRCGRIEVRADGDVAVVLDGDVDVLADVARTVGKAAERIHIYVDRRDFRPAVVVASLGPQRPGSRLAAGLEAVVPGDGEGWPVSELALVRTRWLAGGAVSEVFDRVPIGAGLAAGAGSGADPWPGE